LNKIWLESPLLYSSFIHRVLSPLKNTRDLLHPQNRQRMTEPRPQATCTQNLVKLERVVFELCKPTDRQTYSSQYFATISGRSN